MGVVRRDIEHTHILQGRDDIQKDLQGSANTGANGEHSAERGKQEGLA